MNMALRKLEQTAHATLEDAEVLGGKKKKRKVSEEKFKNIVNEPLRVHLIQEIDIIIHQISRQVQERQQEYRTFQLSHRNDEIWIEGFKKKNMEETTVSSKW